MLDSTGHVVKTISGGPINGPWDMTSVSAGRSPTCSSRTSSTARSRTGETPTDGGTVVRIGLFTPFDHAPVVTSERVIADGFPERTDEAALVVGPTGDRPGPRRDAVRRRHAGQPHRRGPDALFRQTPLADGGLTVARGGFLNNPLGLTIAPNGDILTANANDGDIVETTPSGAEFRPFETGAGEGGLFGLTIAPNRQGVYFVNDSNNTLDLLH